MPYLLPSRRPDGSFPSAARRGEGSPEQQPSCLLHSGPSRGKYHGSHVCVCGRWGARRVAHRRPREMSCARVACVDGMWTSSVGERWGYPSVPNNGASASLRFPVLRPHGDFRYAPGRRQVCITCGQLPAYTACIRPVQAVYFTLGIGAARPIHAHQAANHRRISLLI